jgi:hypothetical protein
MTLWDDVEDILDIAYPVEPSAALQAQAIVATGACVW